LRHTQKGAHFKKYSFWELLLMKLTTRGRYAVTAMLDLALYSKKDPVSLSEISQRQGISTNYLEQLFVLLRKKQLVVSIRGAQGGYKLSRRSDLIYIDEVIDAVNESVDATRCQGGVGCQQGIRCLTHQLWDDLSTEIRNFFGGISLDSLSKRNYVQQTCKRQRERLLGAELNKN
jgi:Rrf2 family iron-sulfur cluster assembly transcriptional regulator